MTTSPGLAPAEPVELSDHELVTRFVSGDESAFEALFSRHSRMVYSTCLRILRDQSTAEDALQSVFIIFARKASSLPPPTVIGGWLYITARTCALKMRQQRDIRHMHERQQELPMSTSEEPSEWQELRPLIDQALAALPSVQRDAIITHYLGKKSVADTARILNCPVETVHTRLTRGMQRLRKRCRSISAASLTALLSGLSTADVSAATAQQAVATALEHQTPTPDISALTTSVINQGTTYSFGVIATAGALPLLVGVSLWYWFSEPTQPTDVVPPASAPAPTLPITHQQPAPVAPPTPSPPEPALPDPLAGWTFERLPGSAVTLERDGVTTKVMRIGETKQVEPFGRAIRTLTTGDGGFICEYDYKLASDFVFPRLFFGRPMDAFQIQREFRRSDFPDQTYTQNRADHQWYHMQIRCEPISQGWQITYTEEGSDPRIEVFPALPEYFVFYVFNGVLDIDGWRCDPINPRPDNEF